MAAGEKTITTTNDEPKTAKPEDVTKAQTEAREEYEESHKFTGDQLTPEEYYAVGRGKDAKVRDAVPGEDTLPQSSVRIPEGSDLAVRTHRTTSRSIKTEKE